MTVELKKENILTNLNFQTKEEVLRFLANHLYEEGYVKEEYKKAIIEREHRYPTGLPSAGVNIAIPHTNHDLVNETTIAIGILDKPVSFYSMEDSETPLDIQIVIMLAIGEPKGQIEMLQRIVAIIQNEELTKKILASDSTEKIINLLEPVLIKDK
ncbi:PTS sugar transporter subunit IIA [Marinilactibacillus psychrotolerans]|uniref:PTS sugar transporter subunit IIA n=1 Tax=Marinilactibacillus psychrotolerans TaxID=191770 RepID=A0A5R9C193_9LACT|nr:PTS sugar transporter subunit IIA [Marinilactibacillus psychrotolerans]TLQ06433.1 PTS sugar transporter subunit IIA [Marinilactibacillus psychrotolerans]